MEFSLFHPTGTSGDGAAAYTEAQLAAIFRRVFLGDNHASQGVLTGCDGELAVTGATSPLTVAAGAAVVNGYLYYNDAPISLVVAEPAATTGGHVILRLDTTTHTVRALAVLSTSGVTAPPTLTQTSSIWEIRLATFIITTGGVITLTDARQAAHYPTRVANENLDSACVDSRVLADNAVTLGKIGTGAILNTHVAPGSLNGDRLIGDSVTAAQIAPTAIGNSELADDAVDDRTAGARVPQLPRRQGGSATDWNAPGTTTYTPGAVRMQCGAVVTAPDGFAIITFPIAFSAVPLVFVTQATNGGNIGIDVVSITTSQLTVFTMNAGDSGANGSRTVNWLAIGPE